MICNNCHKDISAATYYFICSSCPSLKFCKTCRGIGKSIHEHSLIKFDLLKETKQNEKEKTKEDLILEKLDEKLGVENDNIVGGIPTKFHYTKVKNDDFGLTDEMLLYLDEKTLNKLVPVKGLAPYRDQEYKINKFALQKEMKKIRKEIERKKEIINNKSQEENENVSKNVILLGKKKKQNEEINKVANVDKKRLESYLKN